MSQYPQSPLPYDVPAAYTQQRRPTAVLVIAIIVIVFCAMTLLCSPMQLLPLFMTNLEAKPNPAIDALRNSKILTALTVIMMVAGLALSIAQLVAAIAAIRMRTWARVGMINLAAIELALLVVGLLIYFILTYPEITKLAANDPQFKNLMPVVAAFTVGGAFFRAVLPLITIIFFRKPNIVQAFENPAPAAGDLPYPPAQ